MSSDKPLFKKVLIANDSLLGIDVALSKAAVFEHYSGAEIEVAEVIYDTIAEEPPTVLPPEQQAQLIEALKAAERNGMAQLVAPYQEHVASISAQVLWSKNSASGILGASTGVDLLIKPVSRHQKLIDRLATPLDWSLMRSAACPVMISKQDWGETKYVVAAVDAADDTHSGLNRRIIETADDLARMLGCALHIVAAHPSLGQSVNELQVAMDYDGIKQDMRDSREKIIRALVGELDVNPAEISLVEGAPSTVIPDYANRLAATLTVLGTAARRGLSQLLIGNTAEGIISELEGDIVTVREPA